MFQVALSLPLAFEKLIISALKKKDQERCIVARDSCGKRNTTRGVTKIEKARRQQGMRIRAAQNVKLIN